MKHNFDEVYSRQGSDCKKYDPAKFGDDVLPMWIADMDFRCPEPVIKSVAERLQHECFGYPAELPEYSKYAKLWMQKRHGWDFDPKAVEFVTGVVPAAILAIREFSHPGDFILVHTPLYSPLREAVRDNGRQLVEQSLIEKDGYYTIDFERMEQQLADPRCTMFILCNPHNPVGRVWTADELRKIGELCYRHKVIIFNDEIHADIVYSGYRHCCLPSLDPRFEEITITSFNPGKTFNVAGIRSAGVIIPNDELRARFIKSRKNNKAMGRTVFGQHAFIACYRDCEYYADQLVEYLEENQNMVAEYLATHIPEIRFRKQEGLYLLWLDCRKLNLSQPELTQLFVKAGKIGLNSGTDFGVEGTGFMRLNIAVPKATLQEGLRRLEKAVSWCRR